MARYTANGALDPTFNGIGRVTTHFGRSFSTYDSGEGVAIQADGRIVVMGYGAESTQFGGYYTRDLQLARYETNGALDPSFSDDGRMETSWYADSLGYGVALESNGRIVTFGQAAGALALARINTDGTVDATFSDNGKQTDRGRAPRPQRVWRRRRRAGRRQAGGRRDQLRRRLRDRALPRRPAGSQPAESEHTGHADHRRSVRADERGRAVVQVHGHAFGLDVRVQARRAGHRDGHVRELRVAEGVRPAHGRPVQRSRFARHAPGSPTRPRRRGRSPSIRWRRGWSTTLSRQSLRATRGRS